MRALPPKLVRLVDACWMSALVLVLAGCGRARTSARHDHPPQNQAPVMPTSPPPSSPDAGPPPRADVDLSGECTPATMQPVADVLADASHPCRAWVEALYGRLTTVWQRYGGTYWAVDDKGIGLVVTCQHCFETVGGLHVPRAGERLVAALGLPPQVIDGAVHSIQREGQFGENAVFLFGYTLFAPEIPPGSKNEQGVLDLPPRDDFVLLAVPGDVVRPPPGQLWMEPPARMSSTPAIHPDPLGLTRAQVVTAQPIAGEPILALGFPHMLAGQLTFTVSTPLADDVAAEMVRRAEPDEARIEYDPQVEFLFPAQSIDGCSGGGVFDRFGRYLGVMVRASVTTVDGEYFTRVVRASYIAAQLHDALEQADDELRTELNPLVAPLLRDAR